MFINADGVVFVLAFMSAVTALSVAVLLVQAVWFVRLARSRPSAGALILGLALVPLIGFHAVEILRVPDGRGRAALRLLCPALLIWSAFATVVIAARSRSAAEGGVPVTADGLLLWLGLVLIFYLAFVMLVRVLLRLRGWHALSVGAAATGLLLVILF